MIHMITENAGFSKLRTVQPGPVTGPLYRIFLADNQHLRPGPDNMFNTQGEYSWAGPRTEILDYGLDQGLSIMTDN